MFSSAGAFAFAGVTFGRALGAAGGGIKLASFALAGVITGGFALHGIGFGDAPTGPAFAISSVPITVAPATL